MCDTLNEVAIFSLPNLHTHYYTLGNTIIHVQPCMQTCIDSACKYMYASVYCCIHNSTSNTKAGRTKDAYLKTPEGTTQTTNFCIASVRVHCTCTSGRHSIKSHCITEKKPVTAVSSSWSVSLEMVWRLYIAGNKQNQMEKLSWE